MVEGTVYAQILLLKVITQFIVKAEAGNEPRLMGPRATPSLRK